MKFSKSISLLVFGISTLSLIATICGIFTNYGPGAHNFTTIFGQVVSIYGKGIYGNNTVVAALQAIPQDWVTLIIGVPLLILSLFLGKSGLAQKAKYCWLDH